MTLPPTTTQTTVQSMRRQRSRLHQPKRFSHSVHRRHPLVVCHIVLLVFGKIWSVYNRVCFDHVFNHFQDGVQAREPRGERCFSQTRSKCV
jgi:hypothetical protein